MTAKEAKKITDIRREEIQKHNIFLAEALRKNADEIIKEAAEKGRGECILKTNVNTCDEIIRHVLFLLQNDGFSAHRQANNIFIKW